MLHPQEVAVILLNYNGAQDTIACLHSLYSLESLPGAIIIVDNASTDDSVLQIMSVWQQWATPRLVRQQCRDPAGEGFDVLHGILDPQ